MADIEILKVNGQKVGDFRDPSKAPKNTTLAGYGITDAYTKEEINNLASGLNQEISGIKSRERSYATKDEIAQEGFITRAVNDLVNYYKKSETYTQAQINNMLATVEDFEPMIGTRPASGEPMKIYFEPNQEGDSYSEYLWDGTQYVLLATHSGDIGSIISQDVECGESAKVPSSHAVSKAINDATAATEVFTTRDCVLNNTLIKADGTLNESVNGYRTSKRIPISKHHTKLMFFDVWNYGANAFRSIAIYDDNDTVIAYEGNGDRYGEIDLTQLVNPSYFRFAVNEDIQENGHSICVVLKSESTNIATLSANVIDLQRKYGSKIIALSISDATDTGVVLTCEGNAETTSTDHGSYVSEYLEVYPSTVITAEHLFARGGKWAGLVLYDAEKFPVATFGGNVSISISDFPNVKYFKYCVGMEYYDFNLSYNIPSANDGELDSASVDILSSGRLIYDSSACTLEHTGIRYDGTIDRGISTLVCSEKIPLGIAKYLVHSNIWPFGENAFCALAIYNDKDTVLYRGTKFGIVDLSLLSGASYFRFVADKGTDYTRQVRYDLPVVALCMDKKFIIDSSKYDATKYIDVREEYRLGVTDLSGHTGWGFNHPSQADINVNTIEISYDTSQSSVGDIVTVWVGEIDQRGWFIMRQESRLQIVKQDTSFNINYYKPIDGLVIKKNEVCIVKCGALVSFTILESSPSSGEMISWEGDTASSLDIRNDHVCLCHFVVSGDFVDTTSSSSTTNVDMNEIEEEIALSKVLTDTSTGDKYELTINNGVLGVKDITVHKILVIGNSYTTHENVSTTWQGDGRGMAASVDSTQYTEFIKRATGAELDILRGVDFERNYSTSFNFSSAFPINKEYDVVIVQLNENATYNSTMQASWGALYDYIRNRLPNAKIIQVIGTSVEAKTNAITAAASPRNITVLDCTGDKETGKYWLGCYVTGADGNYYEIVNSGVSNGHPSDVGMYLIARRILRALKYSIDNPLRKIFVNEVDGGTITLPYNSWPVGGVLNVLCSSNISALSVIRSNGSVVQATPRTNSKGIFYTFIMPDDSVTITPTWN